jgi:hypothetical protein
MMRFCAAASLMLGMSMVFAPNALAQGGSSSVVVLKFGHSNVDQDLMDHFYLELHQAIRSHATMDIAAGGEVTIDDLLITVGCDEPTPDCLAGLQDFVEGDRIVFGTVSRSGDAHSFSIHLFDFASSAFLYDGKPLLLQGDRAALRRGVGPMVETVLYGEVGQLRVSAEGASSAHVLVNGVERGLAPVTLTELPFGDTEITVRNQDGEERSESVVLRYGRVEEFTARFDAPMRKDLPVAREGNPFLLPAIAVTTLGVAGVVVGLVGQTQLSALESDASSLVAGRTALRQDEVSRAAALQEDMNSAHTLRVVGFSVGGVALAAGAGLFYKALSSGEDRAPAVASHSRRLQWGVGPSSVMVGGSF